MIKAAKALGFHVITSGNRADDQGHRYSDECHLADFSDKNAMLALAKRLRIKAVCAACNDFSALSAAYIAEQLGLPGHDSSEVAEVLHHKDRYRHFARQHGIGSPRAAGFTSMESAIEALPQFEMPLIVKPVDLTGGKGIAKAETRAGAIEALSVAFQMSRAKRVVIEEFIEGSRHGISTLICNGKVVFSFDDDEYYYKNPYMVSAASVPGSAPREAISRLAKMIEKIARILALKDGIVHVQFIMDRAGAPVIIEICRRPPGDLYVDLVKLATGVDYPEQIVRAAAGLPFSSMQPAAPPQNVTRHCMMASRPGVVRDVEIDLDIHERMIDSMLWWKPGDVIEYPLTHKLGIVFIRFDTPEKMRETTAKMEEKIKVRLQ